MFWVDGEIQNMKSIFMQFINHEPDYFIVLFRNHPDAVPLPEATNEVVFTPSELKACVLDSEDRGHIPADHPANMNAHRFGFHVGLLSSETPQNKGHHALTQRGQVLSLEDNDDHFGTKVSKKADLEPRRKRSSFERC